MKWLWTHKTIRNNNDDINEFSNPTLQLCHYFIPSWNMVLGSNPPYLFVEGKFFAQRIFFHFLRVFCEGYYPKSAIKFWKIMEFWYKIHSSLTCSITSSRSSVTDVTSATSVCCIASFFLIRWAAIESSYLCSITLSQLLITIASFLTSFMSNCFRKKNLFLSYHLQWYLLQKCLCHHQSGGKNGGR